MANEPLDGTPGIEPNGGQSTAESEEAWLRSLPPEIRDALTALAARERKTIPALLQDAIALEKWIADLKSNGNKIFVQGRNGGLREVRVK